MLIPVRCFTCAEVIGNKYRYYVAQVRKRTNDPDRTMVYLTDEAVKTAEGDVLDEMELTRPCCRRHLLTHVGGE